MRRSGESKQQVGNKLGYHHLVVSLQVSRGWQWLASLEAIGHCQALESLGGRWASYHG